jgi:hypothetical protein
MLDKEMLELLEVASVENVKKFFNLIENKNSDNSSKLTSSGSNSKLASSGSNSQLASSGNASQLASSGDYSKLASSGDYSKLASSGDYSKLVSSGYSSTLALLGGNSAGSIVGFFSCISGINGTIITGVSYTKINEKITPFKGVCGIIGENGLKENTDYIAYKNMFIEYVTIDGIECGIISKKGKIYKVILKSNYEIAYIIEHNGQYAHGESIKEAKESLIYKISNRDKSKYENWKLDDIKSFSEIIESYRVITGACEFGVRNFVESNNIEKKPYSIREVIEKVSGNYGCNEYKDFFQK